MEVLVADTSAARLVNLFLIFDLGENELGSEVGKGN